MNPTQSLHVQTMADTPDAAIKHSSETKNLSQQHCDCTAIYKTQNKTTETKYSN
jgi:hypothetical protein